MTSGVRHRHLHETYLKDILLSAQRIPEKDDCALTRSKVWHSAKQLKFLFYNVIFLSRVPIVFLETEKAFFACLLVWRRSINKLRKSRGRDCTAVLRHERTSFFSLSRSLSLSQTHSAIFSVRQKDEQRGSTMSGKGVFVLHAVPLFVVTPVLHGDDTQTHARNTAIKKKKKNTGSSVYEKLSSIGTWTRVRNNEHCGQVAAATSTFFF